MGCLPYWYSFCRLPSSRRRLVTILVPIWYLVSRKLSSWQRSFLCAYGGSLHFVDGQANTHSTGCVESDCRSRKTLLHCLVIPKRRRGRFAPDPSKNTRPGFSQALPVPADAASKPQGMVYGSQQNSFRPPSTKVTCDLSNPKGNVTADYFSALNGGSGTANVNRCPSRRVFFSERSVLSEAF